MATAPSPLPRLVRLAALLAFGLACSLSWGGSTYRVVEIGALGATLGYANNINDSGAVVGNVIYSDGHMQAFVWDAASGVRRVDPKARQSTATAINNKGVIVGSALALDPSPDAAIWSPGMPRQDIAWGSYGAEATSINDKGEVVGYRNDGIYVIRNHAFSWPASDPYSAWNDIFADDQDSFASDINDHGQIVGYLGGEAVFVDRDGTSSNLQPQLALPPVSTGVSINDRGEILLRQCGIPFLIRNRQPINISDSDAVVPKGLNAFGVVVGYVDEGARRGFVWNARTGITYLDDVISTPGWQILSANAINRKGQIAGYGIKNGRRRAVLLVP